MNILKSFINKGMCSLLFLAGGAGVLASCADMLDTQSSMLVSEPNINQKSDSVFYAYGIMQAMQQLADQHFFQNEMRGDLVTPTKQASTHLKNLAAFTAGTENKYDSVYLYYKVINNCNYYLQHRDTTLRSGTKNVTINEYAAVASFRAWAYLQLAKQYGDVPYVTTPVTSVSEINAKTAPTSYRNILSSEAAYLQSIKSKYGDDYLTVPQYRQYVDVGHFNWQTSATKRIFPSKCFIPINLILGDLYLEIGEYERAVEAYHDYLVQTARISGMSAISVNYCNRLSPIDRQIVWPMDYNDAQNQTLNLNISTWTNIFFGGAEEVISYIPMPVNYTMGQTTEVPLAFGYDYYGTKRNYVSNGASNSPEINELQVMPASDYLNAVRNAPYYYFTNEKDPAVTTTRYLISSVNLGDGRGNILKPGINVADTALLFVQKPLYANIFLYRNTTVFMHLAEALNRMGEPQLAFAVLKSGFNTGIKAYVDTAYTEEAKIPLENYYIPYASFDRMRKGKTDFFSQANENYFTNTNRKELVGIHLHGAGAVEDIRSPYTFKSIVEARIAQLREKFRPQLVGTPMNIQDNKDEYIEAVEDLLCDEYALEFAFEGTRFSDLQRIARHKNLSSPYGAGFGFTWFTDKLKKNTSRTFHAETDWYLPFK